MCDHWQLICDFVHDILTWFLCFGDDILLDFLVAAKSLFSHMATRDIHIANGSHYITTRWPSWWKSYPISDSKECTFSNHDIIVINQLLDNLSDFSNVAYPLHLSLCSTNHYINFKCTSSAMIVVEIINHCDWLSFWSFLQAKLFYWPNN